MHGSLPDAKRVTEGNLAHREKEPLRVLLATAIILILASSSTQGVSVLKTGSTPEANPALVRQASPQRYVTLFPVSSSPNPSPWILYPDSDNSTVWVAGFATGTPLISRIWEFFVANASSRTILSLSNTIVNSIIVDHFHNKLWFAYNSTVGYYSTLYGNTTYPLVFPNESPQYLALDHQGRLWMTLSGNLGASEIAVYNETSLEKYPVRTANATVQGITVAPDDSIWFAEATSKKIGHLVPSDPYQLTEFRAPSSLNLQAPVQVAVDNSGNVWFTDHGDNQFGVFNPPSTWQTFPIGYCPPNGCPYGLPNAISIDAKNTIWFSEHIAGRIAHYEPQNGLLIEYIVSPSSGTPLTWWSAPGRNNLVWFVAWGAGEIGYVNASVPIPFSLARHSGDLTIQRGSSRSVSLTVSLTQGALSFGVSPLTQDDNGGFPSQVFGSSSSNLTPVAGSQTATLSLSAAWNATVTPRYVALTASDGEVAMNVYVKVVVVEASTPYVALGFASAIALGGLVFLLRRPRR